MERQSLLKRTREGVPHQSFCKAGILTLIGVLLSDSVDMIGSLDRFGWFLMTLTVIQILIEPIYKVWFTRKGMFWRDYYGIQQ